MPDTVLPDPASAPSRRSRFGVRAARTEATAPARNQALIIGMHLARSVRGRPGAPPCMVPYGAA